jgi:DNA-binding NarL/FixJ family response regulator
VAILGGATVVRRRSASLLEDAGFVVGGPGDSDVVVILTAGTAAQRIASIRSAAARHDGACLLAVTSADSPNALLRRALVAGATGLLLEADLERALVPSVMALLAGQLAVPSALSRQIAPRPLSHREKEVLALVAAGFTNLEIAQRLFLAESTVKTHLSSAFRKVDARSRAEAVARLQDPEIGPVLGAASLPVPAALSPAG